MLHVLNTTSSPATQAALQSALAPRAGILGFFYDGLLWPVTKAESDAYVAGRLSLDDIARSRGVAISD